MMIEPTEREIAYIRESLYRFNDAAVGEDHHAPLHLTEKNADGEILGGILGGTYWGWMYVDILWVKAEHRGRGIGSRLLMAAEQEAIRRGCHPCIWTP